MGAEAPHHILATNVVGGKGSLKYDRLCC